MLDDILAHSLNNTEGVWFRTPFSKSNKVLATLKMAKIPKGAMKFDFVATNLGQHDLAALMLSHAEKLSNFDLRWNHRFAGVTQNENGATVCAVTPKGEKFFEADYVIGCDGAGSSVRRALCIPFEGHTWEVLSVLKNSIDIQGLSICRDECEISIRQVWIWCC